MLNLAFKFDRVEEIWQKFASLHKNFQMSQTIVNFYRKILKYVNQFFYYVLPKNYLRMYEYAQKTGPKISLKTLKLAQF